MKEPIESILVKAFGSGDVCRGLELIEASQEQGGASLRAAFGPGSANSTALTLSVQPESPAHAAEPLLALGQAVLQLECGTGVQGKEFIAPFHTKHPSHVVLTKYTF